MELNTLETTDIRRGLITWTGDFPPNIVEFKKICAEPKLLAPYHREYENKELPAPKDKKIAKNALQEMKEILK